jgi:uncharacterized protein (UPF0548 family)
VAIRLTPATSSDLQGLLDASRADDLTYEPVGLSLDRAAPTALTRRVWSVELPARSFDRAVDAIRDWQIHRGAGLQVLTDGPVAVGTNVAMSAPLPIGHIDVTCRIVAELNEDDRFGFAYGTLSVHPEQGEESFVVSRTEDEARFEIVGVSRPIHPLARLVPAVADRLQDRAVRRYLAAMRRAVATTERPAP